MLGPQKRVLMIGAHPDDEDTELLTILVRGMGAEAAYLSLNRGEGGQNLIGPELGEALGILRTQELLAARKLDGAQQYFTRAYDFGFSKTLEDTWSHWPRDTILKDVVRIVRKFQPQIIVSVFSGTPRDGHGQHQAAGWAALKAFTVAGDSTRFAELSTEEGFRAWTPAKLYRSARFDSAATTLVLDGGVLDPAVGQSYHQVAMRGRSLHRSQDMGQLQRVGPSRVRLALLEDRTASGGNGLFAGIDTTLSGIGGARAASAWHRYLAAVDSAQALRPADWRAKLPLLLQRARMAYQSALLAAGVSDSTGLSGKPITAALEDQRRRLDQALTMSEGLVLDAFTDDHRVVPGQSLEVTLSAWNTSLAPVRVTMRATGCPRCVVSDGLEPKTVLPQQLLTERVKITIDDSARPSTPYYLEQPRRGDLYVWPGTVRGEPFAGAEAEARYDIAYDSHFTVIRELVHRYNDQARGEVREPITVVPRVDVKLDPATEVWPTGSPAPHSILVTLAHGAKDTTTGQVRLEIPAGWPRVKAQPFRLTREDERETFRFTVYPPSNLEAGSFEVRAVAEKSDGKRYDLGVFMVDYPHIRPRAYVKPAVATIRTAPLIIPKLARVGYVRGAADQGPEALRSVGLPIKLLSGVALEQSDLSRYDAIVIGPRAYETEPELAANNPRLLAYARAGGLVIVQYQQYQFFESNYAPHPLAVASRSPGTPLNAATAAQPAGSPQTVGLALRSGHDRVTDESAPVHIVRPSHRSVRTPNRLGASDWSGWVQERGLYFARTWDKAYESVLETHDPGEGPLEGGLLIARVGKGTYVYTGLSFFRQLPAGVPGAFRLFANLLALRTAAERPR